MIMTSLWSLAGHPSRYLKGYDLTKTFEGYGLKVLTTQGEDIDCLRAAISVVTHNGPAAVISKHVMAPGIPDIEGTPHGHDVISVKSAINPQLLLTNMYLGSTKEVGANRAIFADTVNLVLDKLSKEEAAKVTVNDSYLEGSTGLKVIYQRHPEVFVPGGFMERSNFSVTAGFGFDADKFGVFSTFSAFLEMMISEITMGRLNNCNVLCHFSHAGVDEMADNTCHFGINNFFADNGLSDMVAVVQCVLFECDLRFVFSARSKVPYILKEDGTRYFEGGYGFVPAKDETIVEGTAGYVISFGEMLYHSLDAVLQCHQEGLNVGLINKPTLNVVHEQMLQKIGSSPFVLVVESFNQKTGVWFTLCIGNNEAWLQIRHMVETAWAPQVQTNLWSLPACLRVCHAGSGLQRRVSVG
ncbi:thiamine diphosphate-binding protein [Scleroderma citrinum]